MKYDGVGFVCANQQLLSLVFSGHMNIKWPMVMALHILVRCGIWCVFQYCPLMCLLLQCAKRRGHVSMCCCHVAYNLASCIFGAKISFANVSPIYRAYHNPRNCEICASAT